MLLKNKIALVTGSTQNIARQGAKVVVHLRHEVDARKVAQEINGDFYTADVVDAAQVAAMFEHIKKTHGRLDILVNNMAHSTKGGILDIRLKNGIAFWRSI